MATAYTSLLGLALPVTGELSGAWGDTVNTAITALLDSAVSGTTTLSADVDVTLSATAGVANEARQAILLWTAGGTVTRNITAPAQSKAYFVVNRTSSTQSIVIRGAGPTTGVTVLAGTQSLVVWNGTDFVEVASGNVDGPASATDNAVARFDGTTGKLIKNSVVTIADTTGNMAGVGTLGVGGPLTNTGAYTAPSNIAGAGTKTTIQGSTGTGQAGTVGGNGFIELVGGGGTSPWLVFGPQPQFTRRRGGISLQAGTAQGDAGGTFVVGSLIEVRGSNGTNNGTTAGNGSTVQFSAGSTQKIDGNLASASNLGLIGGTSFAAGQVSVFSGTFNTALGQNGGSTFGFSGASETSGSVATIAAGSALIPGSTGGALNLTAGNSTGVAGANVVLTSGTGTSNGKIIFVVGDRGEAMTLSPVGNLLLGGTSDPAGARKAIVIYNSVAPTENIAGGTLYVEAGALKYRGSSGTVTTLANA